MFVCLFVIIYGYMISLLCLFRFLRTQHLCIILQLLGGAGERRGTHTTGAVLLLHAYDKSQKCVCVCVRVRACVFGCVPSSGRYGRYGRWYILHSVVGMKNNSVSCCFVVTVTVSSIPVQNSIPQTRPRQH